MRSHRLRKEHAKHAGQTRRVAYWDKDGARTRVTGRIISSGPTNIWIETEGGTDVFVPHGRVSAILEEVPTRG